MLYLVIDTLCRLKRTFAIASKSFATVPTRLLKPAPSDFVDIVRRFLTIVQKFVTVSKVQLRTDL